MPSALRFIFANALNIFLCIPPFLCGGLLAAATPEDAGTDAKAATEAAVPYPAGLSMPWRLLAIDTEDHAKTQPGLDASAAALAGSWLTSQASLTDYVTKQQRIASLNNRLISDHVQTGSPRNATGRPSLTLEPTWCALMDHYLFFVTAADSERNALLASEHVAINRQAWRAMPGPARTAYLTAQLPKLAQAALQAAASKTAPATDALHVGLTLTRDATRGDEGDSMCLMLLLEQELAKQHTVARTLGGDRLALARSLLHQPPTLRRPTRMLVLDWTYDPAAERRLPIKFGLSGRFLESVYGKHLKPALTTSFDCKDGPANTIACTESGALTALLAAEAKTLQLDDWPQVAKINRAWVYLDRGRAWGLKMNDRLIAQVDGQTVKGHVVRFFGPEEGLISPRGFPIEEGAIAYIRLNQRLTKKGMTFQMDPRTFPTPMPAGR